MTRPGLVAREHELSQLTSAVEDVQAGCGGSVLIAGELGIGKSALLARCLGGVDTNRVEVLHGSCDQLWGSFPLAVMEDLLGTRSAVRGTEAARERRDEIMADATVAGIERLLAVVDAKTAERPVLIALDDLQWADEASMLLWRRLGRVSRLLPLLLIGTCRPVPHGEGLRRFVRELREDGGLLLTLDSLRAEGAAQLARGLLGAEPGPRMTARLEAARGNPLYLRELVDATRRAGMVSIVDGVAELNSVPAGAGAVEGERADAAVLSLAGVIADRLDFLSTDARDTLRTAAILGPRFGVAELAEVLGRTPGELIGPLEQATASGVLESVGARMRFRHALIRQSLYEATPVPLRAALVRRAAQALVAAGSSYERVAQLILGVPEAADGWEVGWLMENLPHLAGTSPKVTADLLALALDHAPLGHPDHDALEGEYAAACQLLGRDAEVEQIAKRMFVRGTPPATIGRAVWLLGLSYLRTGRNREAYRLATDPATVAKLGDPWRGRALALAAMAHRRIGPVERTQELAETALEVGKRIGDGLTQVHSLRMIVAIAKMRGDTVVSRAAYEEALSAVGNDPTLADLKVLLLMDTGIRMEAEDRFDEARVALYEARELAQRLSVIRLGNVQTVLAFVEYFQGRWVEAQAEMESVSDLAANQSPLLHTQNGLLALIAARRGRRQAAKHHLAVIAARPLEEGARHGVLNMAVRAQAALAEQSGHPERALETLAGQLHDSSPYAGRCDFLPALARVALDSGEPALAVEAATAAAFDAEHFPGALNAATVQWCAGLVGDDPWLLGEATDYFRRTRRHSELGVVLEDLSVALARAGRPEPASAALAEALTLGSALGAEWDVRRAAGRLRALGIRPASRRTRVITGWEALTDTELRVAELVAEGRTNTEIAAQMVLSRRTVETHVAHILTKLNVRSRRDVAGVLP